MKPVLQVALDFLNLSRALKVARAAADGGADWLEAGTPLIKSEGLESVRQLRQRFPHHKIVADMKIMDTGRIEAESAFKAGANVVCVLGAADDSTIRECAEAAVNYGGEVMVDMIGRISPLKRAREVRDLGVNYLGTHTSIDDQMRGSDPFKTLRGLSRSVDLPLAVAGGVNSETAAGAV
ncbi:MAG: orotidine 5'-phosphate decarboxylase / HUMPS family protein, partial [Candidatus Aerophobetes bacterium]